MTVLTADVCAETAVVVTVSAVSVSPLPLETLSLPKLAITFSDGVMGNITKNININSGSAIKPPHEIMVILVDFLRFAKNSFILRTLLMFIHSIL